jgi:hypothetical protein
MPFRYERSDVKQQVVVTLYGRFSRDEGFEILNRHRAEKIGSYGVIYELLGLHGEPTIDDMRSFMAEECNIQAEVSRGPIAIVAKPGTTIYKMACTYAVLGRPNLRVEVFHDRQEAEAWLSAEFRRAGVK